MPEEEKIILDKFLMICQKFRKRYYLSKGDILIVDNHRTLHDREETTIELDEKGNLISREIFVSFAYEK
jgi:alpha-ketoglutarate-dependent taurine dioxygenase